MNEKSLNRNHTLYYDRTFHGLPVMQENGPMIMEYLDTLHRVANLALESYSRVFAIRFDLHFPYGMDASNDSIANSYISRFVDSIKAKIRHHRSLAMLRNIYAHDSEVRFVWAREIGKFGRVHYHVAILLNREAYFTLGKIASRHSNMAHRIMESWASALGTKYETALGLVHFPENPVYLFEKGDRSGLEAFFYRASYLCKAGTKEFGNGRHGFGASRS
ncbi:MAG: inovirus Gp2 family protein [Burkholderiales bacterium]|nr:inovirus Gp2 family protein [Burkholderiales bacterium]